MKRIKWSMLLLFIISSIAAELSAQGSIDAAVKRAEGMSSEGIDVNVVRENDPKTKKLARETVSITIRKSPKLADDFLVAFRNEKDNATRSSENKQAGKTRSLSLTFDNDTHTMLYSYNIYDNDERVAISVRKTRKGEKQRTFSDSDQLRQLRDALGTRLKYVMDSVRRIPGVELE